jgi:hypothetical protein
VTVDTDLNKLANRLSARIPKELTMSDRKNATRVSSAFGFCLIAISLVSCGEDDKVKMVADYSAKIQPKLNTVFSQLISDLETTCRRSESYQFFLNARHPKDVLTFDTSTSTGVTTALDSWLIMKCDQGKTQEAKKAFAAGHTIIENYILTLGKLSGAKLVTFDPQVERIGTALQGLPSLSSPELKSTVEAGTAITQILFKLIAKNFQEAQVVTMVDNSDSSLGTLTKNYAISVERYYRDGLLKSESIDEQNFVNVPLSFALAPTGSREIALNPFIKVSLANMLIEGQESMTKRRLFANQYIDLLKEIACDHSKLRVVLNGGMLNSLALGDDSCVSRASVVLPHARGDKSTIEPSLYAKNLLLKYDRMFDKMEQVRSASMLHPK